MAIFSSLFYVFTELGLAVFLLLVLFIGAKLSWCTNELISTVAHAHGSTCAWALGLSGLSSRAVSEILTLQVTCLEITPEE